MGEIAWGRKEKVGEPWVTFHLALRPYRIRELKVWPTGIPTRRRFSSLTGRSFDTRNGIKRKGRRATWCVTLFPVVRLFPQVDGDLVSSSTGLIKILWQIHENYSCLYVPNSCPMTTVATRQKKAPGLWRYQGLK